jgi:iron complex transport system ATP-binding protein
MVLIARALASKPEMLILDEPESNLDFKNQLTILKTIKKLSKDRGISCIINTHYPAHALEIADKSLILCRGCQHYCGNTDSIINCVNMHKAFQVKVAIENIKVNQKVIKCVFPM